VWTNHNAVALLINQSQKNDVKRAGQWRENAKEKKPCVKNRETNLNERLF